MKGSFHFKVETDDRYKLDFQVQPWKQPSFVCVSVFDQSYDLKARNSPEALSYEVHMIASLIRTQLF